MSRLTWDGLSENRILLHEAAKRYHLANESLSKLNVGLGAIMNARSEKTETPELNETGTALKELDEIRKDLEINFKMHPDVINAEILPIIVPKSIIQLKEAQTQVRKLIKEQKKKN